MQTFNELLPVGSVVTLKGESGRWMIMGILHHTAAAQGRVRIWDYMGVPYPEGFVTMEFSRGFDHEDIDSVVFTGYSDKRREVDLQFLEEFSEAGDEAFLHASPAGEDNKTVVTQEPEEEHHESD